jgi:tryptophan halogenase
MALFRDTGKVFREQDELFTETAWQQVMIGQGLMPRDYHPLADALSTKQLDEFLDGVRAIIDDTVRGLSDHEQFLRQFCHARS